MRNDERWLGDTDFGTGAARAGMIYSELSALSDPEKLAVLPKFFKTGPGQYGEGDRFLGVAVPVARSVAARHRSEGFPVMAALLESQWHECRLLALLMLVERFRKAGSDARREIVAFYLARTRHINNWDLVDLSAPYILGEYLKDKPRDTLYRLADSTLLWDQRIAVVSTLALIRDGMFEDTLRLAEKLLPTPHLHDLMQKAIGWMLREVGKRDKAVLEEFLERHSTVMPRTTLRYAIEKFPEEERKYWMRREL